jgi:hypothetical protein
MIRAPPRAIKGLSTGKCGRGRPAMALVSCGFQHDGPLGETMRNTLLTLLLVLLSPAALAADKVPAHPHIEIQTSLGAIKLELDGKQAPLTVAHILKLVDSGYYDGTVFHRVIPGFMARAAALRRA